MPLHHAAQVFVVGYHTGYFTGQVTALPAVQDVRQAVGGVTGQDRHALRLAVVAQAPLHIVLRRQRREFLSKLRGAQLQRAGADNIAHEKPALGHIGVVI